MGIIFYHWNMVTLGDRQNRVHLASDTGVVNNQYRTRTRCNQIFQQLLIDIERVWADISKDRLRTSQDKRVDRRNKRERWNDNFIARLYVEQERRHLKRVCTR